MRIEKITVGSAMVLCLTLAPLNAASNGKGPSPVKTTPAPKAPTHVTNVKAVKAPTVTTANVSSSAKTKAPKATSSRTGITTTTSTTTSATSFSGTSGTTTSGGTRTTATTVGFSKGKVPERLAKNTNLRTKLESRLLAAGYEGTVYQAAYGFKNQGQFIAATNVSCNTGVSFEQLKLQMTGLSVDADGVVLKANVGADGTITLVDPADVTKAAPTRSLGQAIKVVNSTVDATAAAQTATTQADAEIAATSTVTK